MNNVVRIAQPVESTAEEATSSSEGATIHLEGVDVFVREVGTGPPVLLINGLGAHTAMWHQLEQTLGDHRLLQFDLPGAGQSGSPWWPLSVPALARVATGVLDHFGVDAAPVIGYSMGGMVAQQMAHDWPDRVQRLVLVATSPGRGSFFGDQLAMLNVFSPARYLSARLYAKTIGSMVGGRARHDAAWVADQGLLRLKHAPTWRGYLGQLQSLRTWSALPFLHEIPHEVLVLAGEDDPLVPVVNPMMLSHLLPNGRLVVLRHEGHLMAMDPDSRIHGLIPEFIGAEDLDALPSWQRAEDVSADELRIALAGAQRLLSVPWGRDTKTRRHHLKLLKPEHA